MTEFALYSLPVGKGLVALSQCPGLNESYTSDLQVIREWKPSFVVTLLTAKELEGLTARALSGDIPSIGARWVHFPIGDFGVPDADGEKNWPKISTKIQAALNGGGRVLVHCRGGCGRSGMIALRLMVEMGESVGAALSRLRYVRHCAVETDPQYDWAKAGIGMSASSAAPVPHRRLSLR